MRGGEGSAGFDCASVERFVDAYVDSEFTDEDRASLDRHLAGCHACERKVRFHAAWKASFKAAAPRPRLSAEARERIAHRLTDERPPLPAWQKTVWRLAPAVAAAMLLFSWAVSTNRSSPLAEAAISTYRRNLPLEVTGPRETVGAWFAQKVDFAVRPPQMHDANLIGARLANLREHQAAYLVYNVRGNRVSVFVFDPGDLPLEASRRRQVDGREVFLDGARGYHVALVRDRGMGYAFASDLDEDQMVQLVSSAMSH